MKKILISIILITFSFWIITTIYAEDTTKTWSVTVKTTEKIPWANCTEITTGWTWVIKYECKIQKGTWWVLSMLAAMLKYLTYLASIIWVLFIVYNGILYSMWGMDENLKTESKKRIIWTLLWLVVLFLSWPILQIIAPWIYK